MDELVEKLKRAKQASFKMAVLTNEEKSQALERFSDLILKNVSFLLSENKKDLEESQGKISDSLYERLKLTQFKLEQLAEGIHAVSLFEDPVGQILFRHELDRGLILEKKTVPIGVLAVIFESRPDVIPQILSLVLKSGNVALLKGGREAKYSNLAFGKLVNDLNLEFEYLPENWAQLIESREETQKLLGFPQYVDLVIPRGSNELVSSIKKNTEIPVLGHADGICHIYVHGSADMSLALNVVIDAKVQYPASCNAVETLLVDSSIAKNFLEKFEERAEQNKICLLGCARTRKILKNVKEATERDWQTEYGDLRLSVKVVENLDQAMDHINNYGSHHTDAIMAEDKKAQERFLAAVDSATVMVNSSTRFADGFRFGFGAEVGISTSKTHARGPVGIEGLVIYKYLLRGSGQIVADYVGENARPFTHTNLPMD